MKSITFYAYKGGTGRTLAAVNFAIYLARLNLRTIILDMDLEAPGVDSKVPGFSLPKDQRGILDYILDFQRTSKDPGSVASMHVEIPIESPHYSGKIGLIPAGDYLSPDYSSKLNALDWGQIFSKDGVAFFKQLLDRIDSELSPDFLIIDSRTGIGEIGGICTQQLADEVVLLSSLAGESVKMTKHLVNVIEQSPIAAGLGKSISVKVVVSRVPKPLDPSEFKTKCSELFEIPEQKIFFLFSCPSLEQGEFIALSEKQKDDELIANYIQLFHGLDIGLADESIRSQIAKAESSLLSISLEESEARILELAALYPHPEVYRTAMRYYRLRGKAEGVYTQGLKLLDVKPDDEEAQDSVVESFLSERPVGFRGTWAKRPGQPDRTSHVVNIGMQVFKRGKLSPLQSLSLASLFEESGQFQKSHKVAMAAAESKLPPEFRTQAYVVAARSALRGGQTEVAQDLVKQLPQDQLRGQLAEIAIKTTLEAGDPNGAFELSLLVLSKDVTTSLIKLASELADALGRKVDLIQAIITTHDYEYIARNSDLQSAITNLGLGEALAHLKEQKRKRITR